MSGRVAHCGDQDTSVNNWRFSAWARTGRNRRYPFPLPLLYHGAMSFSEMAVLFVLALLLFGPKKLPVIARQIGKILAEFRRASNEFKAQIESEINQLEFQEKQQARQKEEDQKILPPVAPPPESVQAPRSTAPEPAEPGTHFDPGVASNEPNTVAASNTTNA